MSKAHDYYERLGISQDATDDEIRKAYHKAAHRLHPDVNISPGATELFLDIKEAYEILIDPSKRDVYDGKSKEVPLPIRLSTIYSRDSMPWMEEEQLVYTLLEMDVLTDQLEQGEDSSSPINISLVLDCSTSMQGSRLDIVKATAIELVRRLRPYDILSIISFNDYAETILPAAQHAQNLKSESRIRMLQAKGGTEIYQGLSAGIKEIKKNLSPYYINHLIMITDGHTYGDERNCQELAKSVANQNIGISCLGIGSKWNDVFLDSLAKLTGGSSFYIDDPRDIREFLKQKFNDLGNVHVEGILFNLRPGPRVRLNFVYRLQPENTVLDTTLPIRLGNIPKGLNLSLLLEFIITPITPGIQNVLIGEGSLTFNIPKVSETHFRVPINLIRKTSANPLQRPPDKKIIEAMARLTLYRMQEQAKVELASGEYENATARLQNVATHLFSRGEHDLAKTVLKEAVNIRNHKVMSEEGQKKIKYGTRGLFLPYDDKEVINR